MRTVYTALAALLVTHAVATPPNIPSVTVAKPELSALTVAVQGPQDGYSRAKFPHWIIISGACNTRETVLKRDGTSIVTNSACSVISGQWVSPYDGKTWTNATDVDIDHLVPLSNAWKVGVICFSSNTKYGPLTGYISLGLPLGLLASGRLSPTT
jgi:hypothetical protein